MHCSQSLCTVIIACAIAVVSLSPTPVRALSQGPEPSVIAAVDGVEVHEADITAWWQAHDAASFIKVQQDLYEGRRKALDALLEEHLLRREAAARGVSVDDLLARELPTRTLPVTDDEVRQMYERALPLPPGVSLADIKPVAMAYLEQQHLKDARVRFVDALRGAARPAIRLEAPRHALEIHADDPSRGPRSARIQLVEFGDFECPFCRQLEPVLAQLRAIYGDRLRQVWKDYPLSIHQRAQGAAEAARCAADQGRFWDYHDVLFANPDRLGPEDLQTHADSIQIDVSRFAACVREGVHRADIAATLEAAVKSGVAATPTVFINGRAIVGAQPIEVYQRVIDEELAR